MPILPIINSTSITLNSPQTNNVYGSINSSNKYPDINNQNDA